MSSKEKVSAIDDAVLKQAKLASSQGIWQVCKEGDLNRLKKLIDDDPNCVFDRGPVSDLPIHLCFLFNTPAHKECAKYMLENFPQLVNTAYGEGVYDGEVCLHIAIVNHDIEMVEFLVEHGAEINEPRATGKFFSMQGTLYYGEYPLHFAACTGNVHIVQYLLANGADCSAQDSYGNTPLHMMVHRPDPVMYDILMDHCDSRPFLKNLPYVVNGDKTTPMTMAAQHGNKMMFRHLLKRHKIVAWAYGPVTCCHYPLADVDSSTAGAGASESSALELIVRHNHLDLVVLPFINQLFVEKWDRFAGRIFIRAFVLTFLYLLCFSTAIFMRHVQAYGATVHVDEDSGATIVRVIAEVITVFGAAFAACREFFLFMRNRQHRKERAKLAAAVPGSNTNASGSNASPKNANGSSNEGSNGGSNGGINGGSSPSPASPGQIPSPGPSPRPQNASPRPQRRKTRMLTAKLGFKGDDHSTKPRVFQKSTVAVRERSLPALLLYNVVFAVFIIVAAIMRFTERADAEDAVTSIAVIQAWTGLLYYGRGFQLTGPFVIMIQQMATTDVVRFSCIFGVFMLGFGEAFFILFQRAADPEMEFQGWRGFVTLFIGLNGDMTVVPNSNYFSESSLPGFAVLLFVIYTAIATIVLFNLLVAMMVQTFQTVWMSAKKQWALQRAKIILSIEDQMTPENRKEHTIGSVLTEDVDGPRFLTVEEMSADSKRERIPSDDIQKEVRFLSREMIRMKKLVEVQAVMLAQMGGGGGGGLGSSVSAGGGGSVASITSALMSPSVQKKNMRVGVPKNQNPELRVAGLAKNNAGTPKTPMSMWTEMNAKDEDGAAAAGGEHNGFSRNDDKPGNGTAAGSGGGVSALSSSSNRLYIRPEGPQSQSTAWVSTSGRPPSGRRASLTGTSELPNVPEATDHDAAFKSSTISDDELTNILDSTEAPTES